MKKFPFGLDKDRVTEQFEAIADGLKSGSVIPQEVTYTEEQGQEDFVMRTVTLRFAMKVDGEEQSG